MGPIQAKDPVREVCTSCLSLCDWTVSLSGFHRILIVGLADISSSLGLHLERKMEIQIDALVCFSKHLHFE